MDPVTAFLNRFLKEVIYVEQPHPFAKEQNNVCKQIKVLYGLKQAPHVWYKTLIKFLKKLEFTQLKLDHEIIMSVDK